MTIIKFNAMSAYIQIKEKFTNVCGKTVAKRYTSRALRETKEIIKQIKLNNYDVSIEKSFCFAKSKAKERICDFVYCVFSAFHACGLWK